MCGSVHRDTSGPGAYLCVSGEVKAREPQGQQDRDPEVWRSQEAGGRALPFGSSAGAKGASSCAQERGGGGGF